MKKIRFTLLGIAFTAMLAVGVNAQERGNRGGDRGGRETRVQSNNGRGNGNSDIACNFGGTAMLTKINPSKHLFGLSLYLA